MPSSSSSLSPPPPYINNPDPEFTDERLTTSLQMVDNLHPTEHNVTRYAILLLLQFFSLDIWNIVPQYYTQKGKWPDIALENFVRRPRRRRDRLFVPRVFIEFKTEVNSADAIKQLIESISNEHGPNFKSKGFLIGVKGTQWTILDYHLVETQGSKQPECLILNFYDDKVDDTDQSGRPESLKQYKDLDFMDLKSSEDSLNLFKSLEWIGKENEPRDLTPLRHHASHIPISLTMSTIHSLNDGPEEEQDEEMVESFQNEYAHLIPFFRGSSMERDDPMERDN
jgi:hypothetical protein